MLRGYDHWKTTNPADRFLGPDPDEADWAPGDTIDGGPGGEETRLVWCECCEGAGEIEEYPPRPTPQGPHARVWPCTACGGRGWEEIPAEPLTEEDFINLTEAGWTANQP